MIILYFMVRDFKDKKLAMLATFLIVIAPWHLMQSRWGLDCNLMSSMLIISIYMLLKSKNKIGYIIAGLLFGITLYSYALSYIIVPIFLLGTLIYLFLIKKIKITDIICLGIPITILAIPLILNLFVNKGWIQPIQGSMFSTPKLWGYRGAEISIGNIAKNIVPILKTMFAYDINDYNAFAQFGTLYYISIPFFFIGIVESVKNAIQNIRKKEINLDIIIIICFVSVLLCLLCVEGVGISKANAIYIPMIYLIAVGINKIAKKDKRILIAVVCIYLILFISFQYYYFGIYGNRNKNTSFNKTTIEAVQYVESNHKFDNKKINIRTTAIQPYIYTLLANQTSPYEFNKDVVMSGVVYRYGRYLFYNTNINDDTVYILARMKFNSEFREALLQNGFEKEDYKDLEILYKTIEQ